MKRLLSACRTLVQTMLQSIAACISQIDAHLQLVFFFKQQPILSLHYRRTILPAALFPLSNIPCSSIGHIHVSTPAGGQAFLWRLLHECQSDHQTCAIIDPHTELLPFIPALSMTEFNDVLVLQPSDHENAYRMLLSIIHTTGIQFLLVGWNEDESQPLRAMFKDLHIHLKQRSSRVLFFTSGDEQYIFMKKALRSYATFQCVV